MLEPSLGFPGLSSQNQSRHLGDECPTCEVLWCEYRTYHCHCFVLPFFHGGNTYICICIYINKNIKLSSTPCSCPSVAVFANICFSACFSKVPLLGFLPGRTVSGTKQLYPQVSHLGPPNVPKVRGGELVSEFLEPLLSNIRF